MSKKKKVETKVDWCRKCARDTTFVKKDVSEEVYNLVESPWMVWVCMECGVWEQSHGPVARGKAWGQWW